MALDHPLMRLDELVFDLWGAAYSALSSQTSGSFAPAMSRTYGGRLR